jgi:hypothetical protein
MIRQAAFAGQYPLLKGNLHTHTTRSDGKGTPEEVVLKYVAHGYDFLALTDHRLYNYRNPVPGCPITILPGMEMDRGMEGPGIHCFHSVCLGPMKEDGNGFEQDQAFESGKVKDQYEYQKVLDMIHANGNITLYCHPQWSSTPAREFEQLQGNFAMEIWNSGCALENEMDMDAAYWDELLVQGKRIFGAAVDDGHDMNHHCVGFIMVNARNTVSSILNALTDGAFYSSCGPRIHDFYIRDGLAIVECSPCDRVLFIYGHAPNRIVHSGRDPVTRAEFLVPAPYKYLRAVLVDSQGCRAWTNPIFLDDSH